MVRPTAKWRRMSRVYARFARDWPYADFSDAAAQAMFDHENGVPLSQSGFVNGYALGKKWMSVTLAMWREDISKGLLSVNELLGDEYPEWFLKQTGILKYKITNVAEEAA